MNAFNDLHINYWIIIPAAGLGLRMGASIPKQYLTLHQKSILENTISLFANHPKINKILVILPENDQHFPLSTAGSALDITDPDQLVLVQGGPTRVHSVYQGLKALSSYAKDQDWVLIHDAVRPCLKPKDINRLIDQLQNHPVGGIFGIPIRDTLKYVDDGLIMHTLPRENVWCAQTPQMFRFGIVYQAITQAVTQAINSEILVTDDAAAVELLGYKPAMIYGDPTNIKITYPSDLELALNFLQVPEEVDA